MIAIAVFAYYFFKKEKMYQKILLALGVALSGGAFICNFYPAWQVPLAYVLLALLAWIIVTNIKEVKALKFKHWIVVCAALVFMASVVLAYLKDSSAYTEAVLETVYPGKRFDPGGNGFYKGSWYIQTLVYPFKNTGNNSESAVFFCLFPLPMILSSISVVKQIVLRIKNKTGEIDYFSAILLIPAAFITVYCTVGIPSWLAKITLMSYSMALRSIDILCFINIFLLIRMISYRSEKKRGYPIWLAFIVGMLLICYNIANTEKQHSGYMPAFYVSVITLLILALVIVMMCKVTEKFKKGVILTATLLIAFSGLCILPVCRGFDALLEKPASYAVREIVEEDPDAKWMGYGNFVSPQFLIANGAPTVNSVNYIPNMELWSKLDPEGKYNEVYNRYSHVICAFTENETSFELLQPDLMQLNLSYDDVAKTEVEYLFSLGAISEECDVFDLELLYNEDNVFIYKVLYN